VGEGATELIHIGQAVLNLEGTLDYFVENTFNYPTLAEAYKVAALDAWNRMPAGGRAPGFRRSDSGAGTLREGSARDVSATRQAAAAVAAVFARIFQKRTARCAATIGTCS
jgi:hypothetical protein